MFKKLKFVEMAENNAKITLNNKEKDKYIVLNELKEKLNLEHLPRKIESFDISNISGQFLVAGMSVMQDGIVKKNLARRFKIKTVFGQDDPRCMEEVITRRLKHSVDSENGGFGKLPDLILADGGITQIRATKNAINKYKLNIPVYGMVKDDKHRTKALIDENRNEIEVSRELLNLITNFQDSVHNTAIEYHRKLREKSTTKSILDEVEGIGEVRKRQLLKKFGSIKKISEASNEEIAEIKGISLEQAKKIKTSLQKM